MTTREDEEFFVGYLALPHGLKRRTLLSGALALAGLLVASLVLARNTAGAGAAHFAFANAQGTLGVLTTQPTPLVWTLDAAAPGGVRGTLLVRQGKFGLGKASAALDGHAVRVTGTSLERDGQRLIEVSALPVLADDDLSAPERAKILARAHGSLGEVTVTGQIEDSKCYLGRMRPGDKRTHRACAQLCIAGGIPGVLVSRDAQGVETHYLLATRDGASIDQALLPFVAEPISVTGQLSREGDLLILHTDPTQVTRL
jgi:hypothetical protein